MITMLTCLLTYLHLQWTRCMVILRCYWNEWFSHCHWLHLMSDNFFPVWRNIRITRVTYKMSETSLLPPLITDYSSVSVGGEDRFLTGNSQSGWSRGGSMGFGVTTPGRFGFPSNNAFFTRHTANPKRVKHIKGNWRKRDTSRSSSTCKNWCWTCMYFTRWSTGSSHTVNIEKYGHIYGVYAQ